VRAVDVRFLEMQLRIEHRHNDGSWGRFEPRPSHHTSVEHDPERGWADGRIYECTSCDELIRVVPDAESEPGHR
jgi:hypothetical protein